MSNTKYRILAILAILALATACGHFTPQTEPDGQGFTHSLTLKLNIRLARENRKGSGKILWFFDRDRAKMLFLSPINQVYFELLVENEKALLISRKEKKYWQGRFRHLLKRLWNLDVDYQPLRQLVTEGTVPAKASGHQLIFNIEKDQDSGQPLRIEISNDDVSLKFKIAKKTIKTGRLKLEPELNSLQRVDLEEILSLQY